MLERTPQLILARVVRIRGFGDIFSQKHILRERI